MDPATLYTLGTLGAGVLGVGGTISTNQANRAMSREQMRFQERMSSTAAQRSVKDYTAAGLNPALAYDRPASSPSGSTATMENPMTAGISSAIQARQAMSQIRLAAAQTAAAAAQADKTSVEAETARFPLSLMQTMLPGERYSWRQEQYAAREGRMRDIQYTGAQQPYMLRQAAAEAALRELAIPVARGEARYSEKMGAWRPAIGDITSSARMLNAFLTRR